MFSCRREGRPDSKFLDFTNGVQLYLAITESINGYEYCNALHFKLPKTNSFSLTIERISHKALSKFLYEVKSL